MQEQDIQLRIRDLRTFYSHLVRYIGINAVGIIIWAISGGGYFWPIWVLILWGISLGYEAYTLNLFKNHQKYKSIVQSMAKKWEDDMVKRFQEDDKLEHRSHKKDNEKSEDK